MDDQVRVNRGSTDSGGKSTGLGNGAKLSKRELVGSSSWVIFVLFSLRFTEC